jgi:hypothetical protein
MPNYTLTARRDGTVDIVTYSDTVAAYSAWQIARADGYLVTITGDNLAADFAALLAED